MKKFNSNLSHFIILAFGVVSTNFGMLHANTAVPQAEMPKESQVNFQLDLNYVDGGDFISGYLYDEEFLIQQIQANPQVELLNISGQINANVKVMEAISASLNQIKRLDLHGSIRFHNGDGRYYSWETVNWQKVDGAMLQALVGNGATIEIVDLSLSTVDDHALKLLAMGATNLKEIYLSGASMVTDDGVLALAELLPNLAVIDVSSIILSLPTANSEVFAPQISQEAIEKLQNKGITVVYYN